MKAAIVGGGILGTALAYRLTTEGVEVELYEAGRLGGGTSAVGAGWLNSGGKEPFAYHLLNVSGMAEYATLAREFGHAPWYHASGNLKWTTPDKTEQVRADAERLRSWGYPVELLSPKRVTEIEPYLKVPGDVTQVAYYPWEGLADLTQLTGVLAHAAAANGARIHTNTRVASLVTEGEQVTGLTLADGTAVDADVVAVCTGRWSDELVRTAGVGLPMAPSLGFNIYTGPAPVVLNAMVHTPDVNFRPDGSGRVMARTSEFDDAVPIDGAVDPVPDIGKEILARAVKYLPGLEGVAIEGARVAYRSIPGDDHPVVGEVPGRPGLYLLVTHSGGTMGPLFGRLSALEIAHGERDARLATFRPERIVTV
ncbi:NAD(P)/FAD-dependent oxidoreductase [Streptomyces marispadix]|uniref:FAD-binding oxidoreductase n=1 Tax=Streptomyces marispadix TaxID=2922868 RepID=A0ABS9T5L2_9ACTN|nr:FAD-dependent oxidoreductase [Streptomyces marispadix]MCH6163812.1 FAD-binding oxidoreductase [Streptomyces marispadix]